MEIIEVLATSGWRPGEKHDELLLLLSEPMEEVAPASEDLID